MFDLKKLVKGIYDQVNVFDGGKSYGNPTGAPRPKGERSTTQRVIDQINPFDGGRTYNDPAPTPLWQQELLKVAKNPTGYVANKTFDTVKEFYPSQVRDIFDANTEADQIKRIEAGEPRMYVDQQLAKGNVRPNQNLLTGMFNNAVRLGNTGVTAGQALYDTGRLGYSSLFGDDTDYNQKAWELKQNFARNNEPMSGIYNQGTFFNGTNDPALNGDPRAMASKVAGAGLGTASEVLPFTRGYGAVNQAIQGSGKLLGVAGRNAAENTLYGAVNSVSQDLIENRPVDAGRAAQGAAIGGAMGAAIPVVGKVTSKLVRPAISAVDNVVNKVTTKLASPEFKASLASAIPDQGGYIRLPSGKNNQDPVVNQQTGETLSKTIEKLRGFGWSEKDISKYRDAVLGKTQSVIKDKNVLTNLNPTGGLFVDYDPKSRMKMKLSDNITTLDKTMQRSPDELVTIYRGAPSNQKKINAGDFVTTNRELAQSYSGDGNVLEAQVKLRDVLDDTDNPLAEEYIYRPQRRSLVPDEGGYVRLPKKEVPDSINVTPKDTFYHGTSLKDAESLIKNGFNPKQSSKGSNTESPYALFASKVNGKVDDHSAGMYGDTTVKVTPKENVKMLDANSKTYQETMGRSKGAQDSARISKELKSRGYDGIVEKNGEVTIFSHDKFKFSKNVPKPGEPGYLNYHERSAIKYLKENPKQAIKDYNTKTINEFDTNKPNVVSADAAKYIIPDFIPEKSAAYHEPGSAFAKKYYKKLLQDKSTLDQPVLFTAGGTGAGKTTALSHNIGNLNNYAAVYDGNMAKFNSAASKIDEALASGRKVEIAHVYRDPVEAFSNGVIPRIKEEGRVIHLDTHVSTHADSADVILKLAEKYKDNPNVSVGVIDNSRGFKKSVPADVYFLQEKRYNKSILKEKLNEELNKAYREGKITKGEFEASGGTISTETVRQPERAVRSQSQEVTKSTIKRSWMPDEGGYIGLPKKKVSKPRGFTESTQAADNITKETKSLVDGSYKPKTNDTLMGEAKALLTDGAEINFRTTKNLDKKIAATMQEAINLDSKGSHKEAAALFNNLAEHGTELGRAVQAFSMVPKMSPEAIALSAAGRIKAYNKTATKKIPELTGDQLGLIAKHVDEIKSLPEGRERNIAVYKMNETLNSFIPSSFADKAVTVWKAGLLTSLRTHERNLIGGAMMTASEIAKDPFAAATDAILSLSTGKRTTTATVKGMRQAFSKKTRQQVKDMITLGYDPEGLITKYDIKKVNWGPGVVQQTLKKYTDFVFNTLSSEDKIFYNAAYARSLADQAKAEAINQGKRGDKTFIKNLINNADDDMHKIATRDADYTTFHDTNKLADIAGSVKRALRSGPGWSKEAGKIIGEVTMPFTGVPSSIVGKTIAYSPIGLIKGSAKAGKVLWSQTPDLQRQASQEVGRGVIGSGLFGLGAYLMGKGLMTGQPRDAKEADQWKVEGKQANSVMVGGKWRSVNSVGPQTIMLLAGAKAMEESSKPDGSAGNFAAAMGKDQLSQTFLQGVQGPLQAINDPGRYGANYVKSTVSSVVPNMVKDVAKSLDPTMRETNTLGDSLKGSIPLLRNTLLPKRDSLGVEMKQEPSGFGAFIDVFNSKTPISNTVVDETSRLNKLDLTILPSDKKKIGQGDNATKLTAAQANERQKRVGDKIRPLWNAIIKDPRYANESNDEEKRDILQRALTDVNKAVDREMLAMIDSSKLTEPASGRTSKVLNGEISAEDYLASSKTSKKTYNKKGTTKKKTTKKKAGKKAKKGKYDYSKRLIESGSSISAVRDLVRRQSIKAKKVGIA